MAQGSTRPRQKLPVSLNLRPRTGTVSPILFVKAVTNQLRFKGKKVDLIFDERTIKECPAIFNPAQVHHEGGWNEMILKGEKENNEGAVCW